MKHLLLTVALFLLAGASDADFEIKDPASPDEIKAAEEQMRSVKRSSGKYSDDTIQLTRSIYLELIIGNHVHGFKAFDTQVDASDDSVFVGIFHGKSDRERAGAEQFADYLGKELPVILGRSQYQWARDAELIIKVYEGERY